ncbi:MAG: tetratricopeptide repeat protein [Hamadaea sp.]|nr:tetratricopeptide repeat protein [Hamadaea sp.]
MLVGVLGPVEVRPDTGAPVRLRRRRERLLMAVLALWHNRFIPADELVELLWAGRPPASAVANLQTHVAACRRALGDLGERIETGDRSYRLRADATELDHAAFEAGLARATEAYNLGETERSLATVTEALALWRGDLVAQGLDLPETLRPAAEKLAELRLSARELSLTARLDLGRLDEAGGELAALTAAHPLRERLWALLMLARYRAGRQADALAAYQRVRATLDRELGVSPGAELQDLHTRMLRQDPALLPPSASVPRQLPADAVTFTGRGPESAAILAAARAGPVRVVVVDGMGGVGKTTLAVRAAHELAAEYPDGQYFVDLAGFAPGTPMDPGDVLADLVRVAGWQGAHLPESTAARAALWRSVIAGRRVLVVLDNAATAAQVQPLLPGGSTAFVVVTSRSRLAGLATARSVTLDVLPAGDGATLFAKIVDLGQPGRVEAEDAASVVRLCGGLPLAIRLAASRLRARPGWRIADLADRLQDERSRLARLDAGQQGVAAAFRLSYGQLGPERRAFFRRLCLHPGPEIEMLAAAAATDTDPVTAGDLLQDLVDCHLVQEPRAGRFRIHDLVRAYGLDVATGEEGPEARSAGLRRIADWYAHAVHTAALFWPREAAPTTPPGSPTGRLPDFADGDAAARWLVCERHTLLAVVRACALDGLHAHVGALAEDTFRFFYARGYSDDLLAIQHASIAAARTHGDQAALGRSLARLGMSLARLGEYADAAQALRSALPQFRGADDPARSSHVLAALGSCAFFLDDWTTAVSRYRQALVAAGDREPLRSTIYRYIAVHLRARGLLPEARAVLRDALATFERVGADRSAAFALSNLGAVDIAQGRPSDALGTLHRGLAYARTTDDHEAEAFLLAHTGDALLLLDRADEAEEVFRRGLALSEQMRCHSPELLLHNGLGDVRRAQGRWTDAARHHRTAYLLAQTMHERVEQERARVGRERALQGSRVPRSDVLVTDAAPGEAEALRDLVAGLVGPALPSGREPARPPRLEPGSSPDPGRP